MVQTLPNLKNQAFYNISCTVVIPDCSAMLAVSQAPDPIVTLAASSKTRHKYP
jgi:hypothetical protein